MDDPDILVLDVWQLLKDRTEERDRARALAVRLEEENAFLLDELVRWRQIRDPHQPMNPWPQQ